MATPPEPEVYMLDDLSWGAVAAGALGTALQNFYHGDGHGVIGNGIGRASGDATRGFAFQGESSSGNFGWRLIDLDTLADLAVATAGTGFGVDYHGLTQALVIAEFKDSVGGPVHIALYTNSTNHIEVWNGNGTKLATSDYVLPSSALGGGGPMYHMEAVVTVHGSLGAVKVKVENTTIIELVDKNTRNGGSGLIGDIMWHAEGGRRIAEPTVHDGADFLGSQWRVAYVPVAAIGTYTDGTAFPSGTKLQAVDDDPADFETESANYAVLSSAGKLSFVSGPMPALALAVRDIHPQIVVQKSDGGTNTGKIGIKSGSVESYKTAAEAIADGWIAKRLAFRRDIQAGNPLWTIPTAEAFEVILQRVS